MFTLELRSWISTGHKNSGEHNRWVRHLFEQLNSMTDEELAAAESVYMLNGESAFYRFIDTCHAGKP